MQLNFEEIFNLIKIPLAIVGFLAFGIWFLVDTYKMTRFEGKIKRGVKVWSKELTDNTWEYLCSIKQDIFEERKVLFSTHKSNFIRVQDNEVLIHSNPEKFYSTWACVAYIDLTSPTHQIQYRMSLAGIIFLIPFTIFGILIFMASFYFYKKAIDSFIERKASELALQL